jgi:Na+-transporting NADH:ubiquinone oxidoreductase subunit NqrE
LLSIGQAVKLGAGIALVSGIISVIWLLLLTNVLDPDFIAKSVDMQLAELAEQGTMTAEQIQQQKEMSMEYWPAFAYPAILIGSILMGLVIGLVGGLIFKKAAPDY